MTPTKNLLQSLTMMLLLFASFSLSAQMPNTSDTYQIIFNFNGLALDNSGTVTNGTQVVTVSPDSKNTNQHWTFRDAGNGYYHIIDASSQKALEVAGGNTANGTPIQLWDFHGGPNQKWKLADTGGGTEYRLQCEQTGKYVDAPSSGSGVKLHQWDMGGYNQVVKFVNLGGSGNKTGSGGKVAVKGGSGTQGGNTWTNNAKPTGAAKPGNPIKASGTAPVAGASYAGSYPQLELLFKVLDKARQNNNTVLFDGALLGPFDLIQDAVSSFTYPNVENVEVKFTDGRAGFYGKSGSEILPQYKLTESAIKTLEQKGMDATDAAKLIADSNVKDKSYAGSGPLDWDGAQTAFLDAVKASIGDAAMNQHRDKLLSYGLEGALSEPEDAVLSVKGRVNQFWGKDFDIELKFFNMTDAKASKPAPCFEIRLTSPAANMANPVPTKLSDHGVDVPLGDVEVYGPTIVVTNASTLYDKSFDSGINEGFNFFGNVYLSKPGKNNTDNEVLLALGKLMDADEMAVHFAVDNSEATKKALLELGFTSQRAIYPLSDDYVDGADNKVKWRDTNHKFTAKIVRSDLTFEKQATSITLGGGTDFQIAIKDLTTDEKTVLIFTGGLTTDFKSLTGSLTLNGTGRSTTGELSGATHNTSEWKEPFGIPGLTVRQAAFQIGVNPSGIDNIGVMGNLKLDNVDGSFAALADVTNPDQFVGAGSILDISLLQLASGMFMGPAGMVAYQKAIPGSIRQGAEEVLNARLKDFNFSVVPVATSIGGIHFRQEGIVGHGVLDLWGWQSYGELQFDYKDGLKMQAYMDDVEWNVKGVKVFQLQRSQRDAGKSTMDKVYYDTGVKTFRTKTINLGNRPYFKFELGIPQPSGGDVKLMGKASANIYLLGLTADTYMDLTNEGLKFNLDMNAFNALKGGLAVTVGDGKFVGRGNIGYSIGDVYIPSFRATDIPGMPSVPFIDRVRLPSITLPTASSAKIDTEIRAATSGSFGLELHNGHFQWQSYRINIPNFSVDSPPLGVDKIPDMVKGEIKDKAKDLFSEYFKKEGERMAKRFLDIANEAAKKAREAAEAAKKAADAAKKAAEDAAKKAAEEARKKAEQAKKGLKKAKGD
ncbi:MAG: RICIN domain-containing protein [Chitinophagales bacterium]